MHVVDVPYAHRKGERIVCDICPVHCALREGDVGICRGRKVEGGRLIATNYCQVAASHRDPIEKKPLYHFLPGSEIWSVGPNGCNFRCVWCQNCDISQFGVPTRYVAPETMRDEAVSKGSVGIAYTYSEPLIWFETIRDVAPLVKKAGGANVLVTNGYISPEPLEELLPWIDAANVDLKSLDEAVYRRMIGGKRDAVLATIDRLLDAGVHVELTHLLVTDVADREESIERVAAWIAERGKHIPLHISRYFPHHRSTQPPTSPEFMERAWRIASNHLDFVYLGNIAGSLGRDTHCPSCGAVCVHRSGYRTSADGVNRNGACAACGADLNIQMA